MQRRSFNSCICMTATSRFSRRSKKFSDLKVSRKKRQLEITRDKRTFCFRQLHCIHSAGSRDLNAAERNTVLSGVH